MARVKQPALTAEERARNRRMADERQKARSAEDARAKTLEAQRVLGAQGMPLGPAEVGARQRWMAAWRVEMGFQHVDVQASAPAYRPTPRQIGARPVEGIYEEIEF